LKSLATLLAAAAVTIAAPAMAQDAAGDWLGILEVSAQARLPLVIHLKHDDAGALSGTLDSPAQGVRGLPLAEIAAAEGRLAFTLPAIGGSYAGTWDETAKSWKGEYSQGGMTWPLDFGTPPPPQPLPADWQLPSDEEIRALIDARNAPRAGQGIVVGVLDPGGERIVAGGSGAGAAFDGHTLFEIGSITKVFTALLLADMANRGEVSLDDPAAKYLPSGHTMPERAGRQITLRELSQHRSGLPRMPDNMAYGDQEDPFADYDEARLLAFLDGYRLPRDIGSEWEYSNLGVGLLGYLLARAAGTDYATLVRERITGPLHMDETTITLTPEEAARLAPPLDGYMRPTKRWNLAVLQGAGAIRSSAADMLKFAAATLDPNSPIAPMVRTALAARAPSDNPRNEQALGWIVLHPTPDRDILLHDGGTGGYRSLIAIEPAKGRAVVTLVNSAAEPSAADIGLRVLTGSQVAPTPPVAAAPPPPSPHSEIALPAAELDKFVGRYEFGGGVVFVVTRDGDRLLAQRQGVVTGPVLQIFPEAPLAFFWKLVDAQIRFTTDAGGAVTGAEFKQGAYSATGSKTSP
jgi:CubicO group peptidase (beta-lactamase class C family)